MNLQAFLADLHRREIQLRADGDRLHCNAPAGLLTLQLREQIQQRKSEILAFLRTAKALARQQRAIVPLQPHGSLTPVYAVAGHNGDVFAYRNLARHLGDDQPFFGLQPPGLDDHSEPLTQVEALAGYFATQIREFQPDGPYIIAGYCAGGGIAFELAQQLQRSGATISFIALFACPFPTFFRYGAQLTLRFKQQVARVGRHARALTTLSPEERHSYISEKLLLRQARRDAEHTAASDPALAARANVERATMTAVRRYTPSSFSGRVGLFLPNREWIRSGAAPLRWRSVAGRTEEYYGPDNCNPDLLLLDPDAPAIANLFKQFRDASNRFGAMNAWNRPQNVASAGPVAGPIVHTGDFSVGGLKGWSK